MKTYKKIIEAPQLVISYDENAESPREWDNLGYFIINENNYRSPDGNASDIYDIVVETSDEAHDTAEHIKLMKRAINKTGEKVLAIYPITRYEHSEVSYSLGNKKGFDYSNCGFYIVTDKTAKLVGTPKKRFEKVIENELKTYSQWVNGEVYRFEFHGENGEEDSCSGFYNPDDIKEYLPDDWKNEDMTSYLV